MSAPDGVMVVVLNLAENGQYYTVSDMSGGNIVTLRSGLSSHSSPVLKPEPVRMAFSVTTPVELYWHEQKDGRRVANIYLPEHIDQLPKDVEAITLCGIQMGCWNEEYKLGDADISSLLRFNNLKSLSVGVPISDEGFKAISSLPALEELTLMSFYKVDATRFTILESATSLKKLTLHMGDGMLDTAALDSFRDTRADVKVVS
ncbi:MAG: hypothetical protein ACYTDT_00755 [Planctomycetota bacterium]|jgi:hypothetical protein